MQGISNSVDRRKRVGCSVGFWFGFGFFDWLTRQFSSFEEYLLKLGPWEWTWSLHIFRPTVWSWAWASFHCPSMLSHNCTKFTRFCLLSLLGSLVYLKNPTDCFHKRCTGGNWVLPCLAPVQVLRRGILEPRERGKRRSRVSWGLSPRQGEEAVPLRRLFRARVGVSCCHVAEGEFPTWFSSQGGLDSWAGSWALVCALPLVLLQEKVGWNNLELLSSFRYVS